MIRLWKRRSSEATHQLAVVFRVWTIETDCLLHVPVHCRGIYLVCHFPAKYNQSENKKRRMGIIACKDCRDRPDSLREWKGIRVKSAHSQESGGLHIGDARFRQNESILRTFASNILLNKISWRRQGFLNDNVHCWCTLFLWTAKYFRKFL